MEPTPVTKKPRAIPQQTQAMISAKYNLVAFKSDIPSKNGTIGLIAGTNLPKITVYEPVFAKKLWAFSIIFCLLTKKSDLNKLGPNVLPKKNPAISPEWAPSIAIGTM